MMPDDGTETPLRFDARYRCTKTSKSTGRRCRRRAIPGGDCCTTHGGKAPQTKRAANRRLALGQAMVELEEERRLGRSLPVEPADAMLAMVQEAAANVALYRGLVERLEVGWVDDPFPEDLDDDPGSARDVELGLGSTLAIRTGSTQKPNEATPHVWVAMYDAERERLVKWAKACRDAGVDERRIELAEAQAQMVAGVCRSFAAGSLAMVLDQIGDGADRGRVMSAHEAGWPGLMRRALESADGRAPIVETTATAPPDLAAIRRRAEA